MSLLFVGLFMNIKLQSGNEVEITHPSHGLMSMLLIRQSLISLRTGLTTFPSPHFLGSVGVNESPQIAFFPPLFFPLFFFFKVLLHNLLQTKCYFSSLNGCSSCNIFNSTFLFYKAIQQTHCYMHWSLLLHFPASISILVLLEN